MIEDDSINLESAGVILRLGNRVINCQWKANHDGIFDRLDHIKGEKEI